MKKIGLLVALLGASVAFGADINSINTIVNDADTAGKGVLGVGATWFFAVFFPIACVVGAMVLGFFIAKTKIDQTKEGVGKLWWSVLGAAFVGGFVYFLITASVSAMLLDDRSKLFSVISKFWASALGA